METKCIRIRLKPGCLDQARTWGTEINSRRDDALATLRDEGITLECAFLDCTGEEAYLIYIIRGENLRHAKMVTEQSTHAIDAYHRNFKETCWAERQPLEQLIELSLDPPIT